MLALHVAMLWALTDGSTKREPHEPSPAPARRIALRLIAATPPTRATPARVAVDAAPRSEPTRPVRSAARPKAALPAPPAPDAMPEPAAPQREAAASAEAPAPSLLDTEATRRAIRASARAPALGDQLARARDEPKRAGAQARLADGVKSAGKGDCLKGEYAGSGMGLLSLPFLALAEARGDCAK